MKTIIVRLLAILLFFLALLFPSLTLSGAASGLLLWFNTVLPTLLPCMILADFLLRVGAERYLTRLLYRPLSALFHVSREGSYAVFVGLLSGYPMGARTTASLLQNGAIGREEAGYLLSFVNQPSPMFLTGYLGLTLLAGSAAGGAAESAVGWAAGIGKAAEGAAAGSLLNPIVYVLLSVYGSAYFVSLLYRALRKMNRQLNRQLNQGIHAAGTSHAENIPSAQREQRPATQKNANLSVLSQLESSMMASFEVMVKIGGYMMLFSVVESWVAALPIPWPGLQAAAMGFIEMTTGCRQIVSSLNSLWSAALCCGAVSFGGLSGFFQTQNVLSGSGLSCGRYFLWKLIQGCLAAVIVVLWFFLLGKYPGV